LPRVICGLDGKEQKPFKSPLLTHWLIVSRKNPVDRRLKMQARKLISILLIMMLGASPTTAAGLNDASPENIVAAWIETVASGDANAVADILAPEFQLVRGSGKAYNAQEYIAAGIPKITKVLSVSDVVSSTSGGIMVVRYWLVIDETVDGNTLQKRAPRLTVFRNIDGSWYVAAHANFAVPQE
jgi:ketosteroid isomerase-like protein